MTVSASRVQFIWSPLLGWALLTCVAPGALAQIGVPVPGVTLGTISPGDPTTSTPSDQTPNSSTTTPALGMPITGTTPAATPDAAPAMTTTSTFPAIPLPPGTTVQNPSTQLIPGQSDVFAGATSGVGGISGGGGGAPGGDELGIPLGSFRLYSSIDITNGFDNNAFAQGGTSTTGSLSTIVNPGFALRSEWLNHSINFLVGGGFGFYPQASTQNYKNYFFVADGRIDIREDWTAAWSIGYRRATEALGTPNVAFAQAPTVDESIPFLLSTTKKFNRFSIEVGGGATKSWFTDFSTITSQGLSAENRNRWDYEEHIRFGYEISEDVTLFVGPSIRQTRYDLSPDTLGQDRNSNGTSLSVGARWQINPTSALDGQIGYSVENTGALGTTGAYTFGLAGTWNGYQPLTIRPSLTRSITATALSAYRNTITTVLGFDATYQMFDEWSLAGGMSYSLADYQPIDGLGSSPRQDTFFRTSIGLLWQPRPQLSIGPIFEYSQGGSTDPTNGPSFNRQILSIRLTARR